MIIRILEENELTSAFNLIWEVFMQFVAPDYTQEGIDTFYENYINNDKFREKFINGKETMYGAFYDGQLAGAMSVSKNNTISCLFVLKEFHRKGIGTALFRHIMNVVKERGADCIQLNASPYAEPFYHALGFKDTGSQQVYHGIIYTPMKFNLNE